MSHPYLSPLSTYNSLTDKHLTGYFNNTRIKRHLQRAGLITRSGRILTEKEYRINAMRRDHQRYIRECLAQAIFHKVLDMERHHQIEIRRKLESFAKKEQVRKTKVDHSKRPDDDVLPAFSPRPPAGPRSGVNRHTTTQAEGSDSSESATSPRPNTAPGNMQRPVRLQPLKGNRSALKTSSGSRQKTEDTKFHFSREVDRDIMRLMNTWDPSVGISPYQLPVINNYVMPAPPPPKKRPKQAMSQSLRGRRFRPATAPNGQEVSPKDSGKFHKTSVHSNASITMVYLGKNVHLSHEDDDYRDEIKIFQQHCGGENLCVYKGRLLEGESFTLISRRHRGFPFSLTFYINGIQVDRLSSCCEYKHRKGARLGGKNGYFGFINVEGASPCYRCIISMGLDKKPSPPPKKTEDEEEESEREDKNDEKEDRSAMDCDEIEEKDPGADEKRGRASPSSSSSSDAEKDEPEEKSGMDYEEEREEEKEDNTDVYEADDEAKDEYDEDFEVEEEKTDEKPNDKGQVDDQSDRKSKSPSYDERDDPEHEGNSNEASKQIPETPDSHVKDERVDQSEGNQPGRRSAAEEEMNSAARKIQSLYRKRRIHQEKNQNMKADTEDGSESSSSASSVSSSSSEDESGEDDDDEGENEERAESRSAGVTKKNPDREGESRESERLSPPRAKMQTEAGDEHSDEAEEMEGTHGATTQLGDIVESSRPPSAGDNLGNSPTKEGAGLVDLEEARAEAEGGLDFDPSEDEEEDCKSVQEKIAEAIGADEGRSSEPEASESSTDEEENVKRSFIPHKPLDEKSERDTPGRVLQIENKETGECYPNETTLHEKGSPITTEPEPSPESTLVEDPENSQSVKEANNLDLEMTERGEMVAENTEKEDEEITDDLKIKHETNEEMDIHDDTNHNDVQGTENRPEHIENGAFNDDLLEEIANMDLEGEQIVISDLNEDKDVGEMTDNEMLESIEVLAKELECEEVQTPTEDSSEAMADSTYSALNATFMTHTEQTLSNVEEESEQNEEVHEEFVIEGDLTDELMEMPLASSPTRMSGTGSAEGAEKSQGRASSDAESVEGNSILMKETSDENEKATGVGSVPERDPVTGVDDITKGAAIENDSSTNDPKETEETTPYESEQEHDEDKTQVEEVLGSIENGEVIRVSTADVNETVNEVMLEVEDREFVNEVVLEVEEPELDHNLENKPSVREKEESREGDEVTENTLRVRSADAETIKPAGSMEVKDEEGVDRLIADGIKAVGDTGNGDMAPTGYSSGVAVVVNEEGSPADEIKVEDITDDLGSKDGSPDGEGELVLSEAGETINNSEQTELSDEIEIVEEIGESGKATSEVMDGKTEITVKSLIREEETIPSDSNIQEKEALGDVEETKNADPSDAEVERTYQGIFTEKESSNENVSTSKDPKGSNEDFISDGKVEGADDSTGKESKSGGGGLETDLNAFGYHTEGGPELSRDHTEKEVKSAAGGTEKELELTGDKTETKDIYGGDTDGEDVSDKVGVAKDGAFHEGDNERKERNREKEMDSNENSENVVTTETGEMDTNLKVLSGEQELSSDMGAVDQEKDNESVNDEMDQRATTEHAEENERGDDSILKKDDETLGSCENEVTMEENLVVSLGTEDPIPKEDDQTTAINREMGEIDRNKGKEDGSQSVSMQDVENPDMAAEDEGKNPKAESPKIVLEEETTEAVTAIQTGAETDGPVALGEVGPHAVTEEEVTKIKEGDTEKQQEGVLGLPTSDIMPGSTTREDISETPKEDNQVVERSPSSSAVQTGAETDGPVALGEVGPHTVTEEEVTKIKESHTEQKQKDILGLPTSDIMPGTTTSEDISETPKEDNQVVERSPGSSAVQTGAETEGPIALGEVGPPAVSEGGVTEKKEGDTEQKQKDSLEVPTSDIMPATATREDISETPKEDNKAEERSLSNSANDGEQ